MSNSAKYTKTDFIRLVVSDLDSITSNKEKAREFLVLEGYNPDKLVSEGVKRIKKMQLQIAAAQTKRSMAIAETVKERAIEWAEKVLSQASFSIQDFMSKEQLALNFRNFESLSADDIKEILIKHFTLKFTSEDDSISEDF
ncbi:hypothetical protein D9M68_515090 [compost metagenome]